MLLDTRKGNTPGGAHPLPVCLLGGLNDVILERRNVIADVLLLLLPLLTRLFHETVEVALEDRRPVYPIPFNTIRNRLKTLPTILFLLYNSPDRFRLIVHHKLYL